jgi:small-conductance mechanosensitive channel
VRFKEFGDSNIIFTAVLKSVDRMSQFQLKHEFIKALHKRFQEEGITIEYPVRRLCFSPGETAPLENEKVKNLPRDVTQAS